MGRGSSWLKLLSFLRLDGVKTVKNPGGASPVLATRVGLPGEVIAVKYAYVTRENPGFNCF